jgi:hypothetical protein
MGKHDLHTTGQSRQLADMASFVKHDPRQIGWRVVVRIGRRKEMDAILVV